MDCLLCRLRAIPMPEGTNPEDVGVAIVAAIAIQQEDGFAMLCTDHHEKVRAAKAEARRRNDPRIVLTS